MKMQLKSLSKQQITNNSPPFQFSPLVRHKRMVKRNPYVRRKNQPIPNRRYKTNKHRPNNEGTVIMPTVTADPDPTPSHTGKIVVDPSARLIVKDVHREDVDVGACDLAFLNDFPTQDEVDSGPNKKRQNGGNAFDDFDFGNFNCDVEDYIVVDSHHIVPKRQHHDGLLSVNATMTTDNAPSYNPDADEAHETLNINIHDRLETTVIVVTHNALSNPLSAAEARAIQILER
jgi:hypothetical protein